MVDIKNLMLLKQQTEERYRRMVINNNRPQFRQAYDELLSKYRFHLARFIKDQSSQYRSEHSLSLNEGDRLNINFSDGKPFFKIPGKCQVDLRHFKNFELIHVIHRDDPKDIQPKEVRKNIGTVVYHELILPRP